jgi:ketosteroid isomerase-like protein
MTETIRPIVEAYYKAASERDVATALAMMDENIDWLVQGPIDVFSFFGQRHGKAAVRAGYDEIAKALHVTAFHVETLVVEGDRAAAMIRYTSIVRATGKVMSVRTTQFSRWRDCKIVEMRAVCDSYDLVEQTIGRPLDLGTGDVSLVPV